MKLGIKDVVQVIYGLNYFKVLVWEFEFNPRGLTCINESDFSEIKKLFVSDNKSFYIRNEFPICFKRISRMKNGFPSYE